MGPLDHNPLVLTMARFGDGVEFQLVEGGPETDCELSEHHFVGGLCARGGESPFSPADERLFCCPMVPRYFQWNRGGLDGRRMMPGDDT